MGISEKKLAIIVSVLRVVLCCLLQVTYRPFIYENHLNDFHIADTLTSWICIPAASLFFWGISRNKFTKCLLGSLIGFVIYKLFLGWTFDWYDIIALCIGAGITYLIYFFYKKRSVCRQRIYTDLP